MRVVLVSLLLKWSTAKNVCPAGTSGYEHDTDFKNHDMSPALMNMSTPQECCALCSTTKGCTAISFGPMPHNGCRLKTSDAGRMKMKGRYSFVLDSPAPTPSPPPPPSAIKEIHMVASNHFDGGCKIHGCQTDQPEGWKDPIWPVDCATTMHGPGQPHAYHVLNRYFTNYFPLAAKLGDDRRSNGSDPIMGD